MTCLATDVYPLPAYVWDDIQCDNNKGSTCTFTPHSPTSVTGATCIVKRQRFDGSGNKLASKSVGLNFKCECTLSICSLNFDFHNNLEENQMIATGSTCEMQTRSIHLAVKW